MNSAMPTGRLMESAVRVNDRGGDGRAWKLCCVTITIAENGFIVSKSYERPAPKGKAMSSWEDTHKSEQSVFQTKESMDAFVDRVFGVKD